MSNIITVDIIKCQADRVKRIKVLVKETLDLAVLMVSATDSYMDMDNMVYISKQLIKFVSAQKGEPQDIVRVKLRNFANTTDGGNVLWYYDMNQILNTI